MTQVARTVMTDARGQAESLPARDHALAARVLIVEDEPALLRALRINLRARGYDVATAATGAEGLAAAAPARCGPARPRAARHRRRRGDPRAARLVQGAGDRAVRAGRLRRQDRCPGRGCRRLRHQAV